MGEWQLLKFAKCLAVGSENSTLGLRWDTFESSKKLPIILKITNNGMLTIRHGTSVIEVGDLRGSKPIEVHRQSDSLLVLTQIKENVIRKWRGLFMGTDAEELCEICYSKIMSFTTEKRQLGGLNGSQSAPQESSLSSPTLNRECPTPDDVLETLVPSNSRKMFSSNSDNEPEKIVTSQAESYKPSLLQDSDESSANHPSHSNWFRISQKQMAIANEPCSEVYENNPRASYSSKSINSSTNYRNNFSNNEIKQTTQETTQNSLSDNHLHLPYVVTMEDDDDVIELSCPPIASFSKNVNSVPTASSQKIGGNVKGKVKRPRLIRTNAKSDKNAAAKVVFEIISSSLKNNYSANSSREGLNVISDDALKEVMTKCLLDPNLPALVSRVHRIMSNF